MARKFAEMIPFLKNSSALRKYSDYLDKSGFGMDAMLWIFVSLMVAAGISLGTFVVFPGDIILAAVVFLAVADGFIAYPYMQALKRIEEIEDGLPDVLKQMGDTLRAGGTYEYALREVAEAEFGAMKKGVNEVLRKLEEGENFENSLRTMTERVDSRLVRRTVTIIIDSIRAGAGLADILEQIAEDVRAMNRINRERKSRTLMQVIFIAVAGSMVAPLVFGFVATISNMLITIGAGIVKEPGKIAVALAARDTILLSISFYIVIESAVASVMLALMREGKIAKGFVYFPMLMLLAYIVFIISKALSASLVGGI